MDATRQDSKPAQHQEAPRYEKPTVKKIGNMSANTKQKSVPVVLGD